MGVIYMSGLLQGGMLMADELPAGTILEFNKGLLVDIGIMWLNVAILTVILIKILYNPVKKYMAARTQRIQNEIETARRERDEALDLKEKYETLISDIEREREDVLRQAHKKAMEKSDQLLFDARHEAELMYSRALADLELERKNIQDEMKKQMIEISVMMAGHFVEVSIDREAQDRYIDEAFTDWEGS